MCSSRLYTHQSSPRGPPVSPLCPRSNLALQHVIQEKEEKWSKLENGPYNMFQNRISKWPHVCWMCFFYVVGTVTLWRSDCEEWKCLIRRAPVVSYAVGTELCFKLNEQLDQRSVSVLLFRAGAQTQTPGKNPPILQLLSSPRSMLWFCWQTHQGQCSMCKNSIRGLNVPSNVISFILLEAAKQWNQGCIPNRLLHISRTCSFVGSECTGRTSAPV